MKTSVFGMGFIVIGICILLPETWQKSALLVVFGIGLIGFAGSDVRSPKRSMKDDRGPDFAITDD